LCTMGEPTGTDLLSSISLLFPVHSDISASRALTLPPAFALVSCWAYSSTLKIRKRHVSPKRPLNFNRLHGVISQEMDSFLPGNIC
jgi:hypothetical protein